MRVLLRTFVSGLAVALPIIVTIAVLLWLVGTAESVLGNIFRTFIPQATYRAGMGLGVGILVILIIGFLTRAIFFRRLVLWMETQLHRIPGIKTIYGAMRDITNFIAKNDEQQRFSKVVMVQLPNLPFRLIGFVTVEDFSRLPISVGEDEIAVYMPMSYQIGGYTAFMPRHCVTPVDMSLEEAMRFVVTAGMSRREDPLLETEPPPPPPAAPEPVTPDSESRR